MAARILANTTSLVFGTLVLLATTQFANSADKFGQDISADLEERVTQARQLRLPYSTSYNPTSAITLLEDVISEKPDYFRAYFNLGLAYVELDNPKASRAAFDKALALREKLNIADASIVNTAGWASMQFGDYRRAEELLKQAEGLTKDSGTFTERAVHGNLGELYFLTQRFDESAKYFEIARDKFNNENAQFYLDMISDIKLRSIKE